MGKITVLFLLFLISIVSAHPKTVITEGSIVPYESISGDDGVAKLYRGGKLPILGKGVYRYSGQFLKNDSIPVPALFLGAMYYPCIVSLNGHKLYQWGTLDSLGGMVNYRSNAVLLTPELIRDTNTLTVDFWTDGLTMGLPAFWVGALEEVSFQTELYNAANVTGARIGVSLSFIVFLLAVFAVLFMKHRPPALVNYAFFAITTALTFHMFLFNSSSIDHVIQTKIFRSATLLMGAALFFLISDLTGTFRSKIFRSVLLLLHVPFIVMIWLCSSKFEIEAIVSTAVPVLLAPVITLTFISCIRALVKERKSENWLILINFLVILFATVNDLSSLSRKTLPDIWMLTYAYIFMTFTGAAVLVWRQMIIYAENMKNRQELEVLNRTLETTNAELTAAREEVVQESLAREAFLKTIAHELRTPLTGLLGGVNTVADDDSVPLHLKKPLFYMKSSFHRLFVTVSNLFDFIEIKRGSISILAHPFRLFDVIDPILDFYRDTARAKNISLIVLSSPSIPSELYGDSDHLLQVVDNLLSNAVKFTSVGGVSCEIGYENKSLVISVKDTGVGIAQEKQQAMLKAFSRGEDFSFSQRYEGVGLGLAIVDAVVRSMKGTLSFSSVEGKGSQFCASIPMIASGSRRVAFTVKKRVLVVEDNTINSLMVAKQLESGMFFAEPVFNGLEALEKCRNNTYDAILMDVQMPVMDGITAAREIRKFNVKTPIIALTANGDRMQCMRAGMNEFLLKPISSEKLISVVSNMIQFAEKGL